MSRPARFTQAELIRALKASEKAGVAVGTVDIMPDGAIRITARDAIDQRSPLQQWKARRQA
jgi:hypothetical protein